LSPLIRDILASIDFLTTFFNFWRYKMKKTMIAMAVAGVVAAPIASAEVSISGVVEQTFKNDDTQPTEGWTSETFNMLNFSASEDLGNGMTAFAKYNFLNTDGQTGTATDGDNIVGLTSEYGTVVMGTMEGFTEGKVMSMMTMNGPAGIELGNNNAGRTPGGIAYVSPTVAGLHFGIAGYTDVGTTATGSSDNFDATDMAVFYDNGPLSIKAAVESQSKDASFLTTDGTASDQRQTSFGVSYSMGDLKVAGLWLDHEDTSGVENNDSSDVMMRLDYTMGNNVITVATADDENITGTSDVDTTAVEVKHNFSARTNIYAGLKDHETANNDMSYVGLVHKF